MSDGNFNRNLLPYKNYQSGLRAGKAQMKIKAIEALHECLNDAADKLSVEEQQAIVKKFVLKLEGEKG